MNYWIDGQIWGSGSETTGLPRGLPFGQLSIAPLAELFQERKGKKISGVDSLVTSSAGTPHRATARSKLFCWGNSVSQVGRMSLRAFSCESGFANLIDQAAIADLQRFGRSAPVPLIGF